MSTNLIKFHREKTALKYFLIGRNYHLALKAMGFAERYHVGLRKDGVTPEFHHQIQIALSVIQLKEVTNEELCITAALLHDVQEDYQIPTEVIKAEFGERVAEIVWRLTKKFAETVKNKEEYLETLALDSEASIVKGIDRINNLQSMLGVFQHQKMRDYALEAQQKFLPMLKKASKLFPEQQMAYTTLQLQIKELVKWTNAYVDQAEQYDLEKAGLAADLKKLGTRIDRVAEVTEQNLVKARENSEKNQQLVNTVEALLKTTGFKTLGELATAIEYNLVTVKKQDDQLIKDYFKNVLPIIDEYCKEHYSRGEQATAVRELNDKFKKALGISDLALTTFSSKVTDEIISS